MEIIGTITRSGEKLNFKVTGDNEQALLECDDGSIARDLNEMTAQVFNPQILEYRKYNLTQGIFEAYLVLNKLRSQGLKIEFTEVPDGLIEKAASGGQEVN